MKKLFCILCVLCLLAAVGCAGPEEKKPAEVPADFSFAITWNVYGVSSYDSATGRLVKTTDAAHPEDYATEYRLTQEERAEIYALLTDLSLERYPDEYDPDPGQGSSPSETLILTVRENGAEKTVVCRGVAIGGTGKDAMGKAFRAAIKKISGLLMETPAWESLPDYERFYS